MTLSRELRETWEKGSQVWICSNCDWRRRFAMLAFGTSDSGSRLLVEFVKHDCRENSIRVNEGLAAHSTSFWLHQ